MRWREIVATDFDRRFPRGGVHTTAAQEREQAATRQWPTVNKKEQGDLASEIGQPPSPS